MASTELLVDLRIEVPVADMENPATTESIDRKIAEVTARAEEILGGRVRGAAFVVRHESFLNDATYVPLTSAPPSSSGEVDGAVGETVPIVGAGGSPTAPSSPG